MFQVILLVWRDVGVETAETDLEGSLMALQSRCSPRPSVNVFPEQ